MQSQPANVFTRPDTLLGVCQAIGDDFGFSPLILRIGFALPLFWNPYVTVAAYLALGAIVALSRWFVPNPSTALAQAERTAGETVEACEATVDEPELALAA